MREININEHLTRENPMKIEAFEVQTLNDPLHYHSHSYELTLVHGGAGTRIVGDHISDFSYNDLVLIGPGLPHCWINERIKMNGEPAPMQIISVHFNEHILGKELLNRNEFASVRDLLFWSSRGLLFKNNHSAEATDLFFQFKMEPDLDSFITLLQIFNYLVNSDEYETLCSKEYVFRGKNEEYTKFEMIFDHIQNNYLRKIKISEVAMLAGMNDSAFSHYFKKRTNYSFTDFVNLLRLNHAAGQLGQEQKGIADICFDSGFNNLSNFNRMFKKWKGTTPLQFRKESKKAQEN